MKFVLAAVLTGFSLITLAAEPEQRVQQEVQKALIQRDRQSAEFAAGVNRPALEAFHARQFEQARPDERVRQAREREAFVLQLPPPRIRDRKESSSEVLPLPGGPEHGVEPIAPAGLGG